MSFKKNSISFKIWLYLTASVVLAMTALWVLQAILLPSVFEFRRKTDLKAAAQTLTQGYASEDFTTLLEDTAYKYNISAEVLSADGTVLDSANMLGLRNPFGMGGPPGNPSREPRPEKSLYGRYLDTLKNDLDGVLSTTVSNTRFGNATLLYAVRVGDAYLFLNAEYRPVDGVMVFHELAMIAVFVVLMASLASVFIAKSITKPITDITKASRLLVKDEFPENVSGGRYAETRELADTLRQTAAELRQVETLRRDLIANVSHDLRTPLTMIKAYGEALRDLKDDNPAQKHKDLSVIISESDRLAGLVDDLLELSRMQAGHISLNPAPFSLTALIEGVLSSYKLYADRDGYDIRFEHDGDITVSADEKRILQVMHNLLINAINHSGPDKRVTIRQLTQPDSVRIEVCDTGDGISPEELPYIWDRYFRAGKTHKRPAAGSGLGLSIVKAVLEQHGARYGVLSSEKAGSTFWFELIR